MFLRVLQLGSAIQACGTLLATRGLDVSPHPVQRAKPGSRLRRVPILQGVSSVLRPGRLTLLLGPPGAGKSTLLRALSGQLKLERRLKVRPVMSALHGSLLCCAVLCCAVLSVLSSQLKWE